MIVDSNGYSIDGQGSKLLVMGRSWQEQCAKEIHASASNASEADILGHIKRYSDGIIDHLANCPVTIELRVRVPGASQFQSIARHTISAGKDAATAIRNMRHPIFIESFMLEGKKV
tara:strand:- start:346 stop:693 length:348 start_codon:yes stop_codon:yes gene_type:complete